MYNTRPTLYLTGASGFIGSALRTAFLERGWFVYAQSRRPDKHAEAENLQWCERPQAVERPIDLLINLAGKPLATRWTRSSKDEIYASRIELTLGLMRDFVERPELAPAVVFSASAVGYYAQGDDWRDEQSEGGNGFAARLCRDWEAAAREFTSLGSVVHALRFGVVLDPQGGALATMLPAFRLGLGARLGSGAHWFSWISRADLVSAVQFLYDRRADLPRAINLTAPHPVTNRDFTHKLAAVLNRPGGLMAPAWLLRLLLAEGADEFLLANLRVRSGVLEQLGYNFRHPDLDTAFIDFFQSP